MATKNNKPASAYAKPHTMSGGKVSIENGYESEPKSAADKVNMTIGNISRHGYEAGAKTSGIKVRGTGAATKGTMARGPMA